MARDHAAAPSAHVLLASVTPVPFHGGLVGAVVPFLVFLTGVVGLALAGAPDERGFWPVLLTALAAGLALARDRARYAESVVTAMGQPLVALMILAWLLAGVLGTLLTESGLVQSLVWAAHRLHLGPATFTGAACVVCAMVSTATGTSFGTILVAGPLLYPAGAALGAPPAILMGAVLAGATWGDSISPVSDTTIASAGSQGTDVPGTVRSRLKYVVPAGLLALLASTALAAMLAGPPSTSPAFTGSAMALPMLAVPVVVTVLMIRQRHLVEGLLSGIVLAVALGMLLGLLAPSRLFYIDRAAFGARGLIVDGLGRGVGVSVFTLLLMGLVGGVQASGVLDRVAIRVATAALTPRRAEWWMVALVSAATLLTTHSVVAMLSVGALVQRLGERAGIAAYRRANLLDMTVCTWPFLLPYFLPTILASGATAQPTALGVPRLSPLAIGMANTYAWALVATVTVAIVTGWGRSDAVARQ
jgi:Na+/H+ antiporter NhaC